MKNMSSDIRQEAKHRLADHGIRPSMQRLVIMEYLLSHNNHPSVDEVYQAVSKDAPTLSRTTVYNTLRMFSEQGAAQMITIDEHRVCYDGHTHNHGHFYCRKCGRILDVEAPEMATDPAPCDAHIPADVPGVGHIDEVHYYYKGLCDECAKRLAEQ